MLEYLIPFHPKVVHFPVALFITALGFDLFSFILRKESLHKTALHLYVLASLITPLIARSGLWEEARLHLSHPILERHRMFALWTMWSALASLPLLWFIKKERTKYFRFIFLFFLISMAAFVSLAAHNGGRMVYEYGAGMEES